MKILRCEVENYGTISKKNIDFDGKFEQIYEENGKGKTTLCSFLRVMFYGMETKKGRGTTFGDREHFFPFSGGRFGGAILFENKGKICRIERFFDEKSATKDTFRYFEDDREVAADGTSIGKEIFGIDEEAFERSLLFDATDTEISATNGMRERLGAVAEGTENGANAAEAVKILEDKRKTIGSERNSKNANNEIARLDEEHRRLSEEIGELKDKTAKLDSLYAERARLKEEIATDEKTASGKRAQALLQEKKKTYYNYLSQAEEQKKKLEELAANYPAGTFTKAEIAQLKTLNNQSAHLGAALSAGGLSEGQQKQLDSLKQYFSSGVPSAEVLDSVEEDIDEWEGLEATLKAESAALSAKEQTLCERFDGRKGAQEDFTKAAVLSQEFVLSKSKLDEEKKRLEIERAKSEQSAENLARQSHNGAKIGLFIAAIVCACVGVFLFSKSVAAAIALIAAGAILGGVGALCFKGKNGGAKAGEKVLPNEDTLHALEVENRRLQEGLKAILERYGYASDDVLRAFDRAADDFAAYDDMKKRLSAIENERQIKTEQKQAIERKLTEFFTQYHLVEGKYRQQLSRLKLGIEKYNDLLQTEGAQGEKRAQITAQIRGLNDEMAAIFENHKTVMPQAENIGGAIEALQEDSLSFEQYTKQEQYYRAKAEEYKTREKLPDAFLAEPLQNVEGASAEEETAAIEGALNEKRKAASDIDRDIIDCEDKLKSIEEKERALAENEEKYKDAKYRYNIYRLAVELLQEADGNIMRKYVDPVKEKFVSYAELIEEELGVEVCMNRDFSLTFSRGGAMRKDLHFSAGVRSVCAFCLRLSLIDTMFEGREQPFLILDDPFVHLDENHFARTAALLQKISEKRQLIYFTCHSSRKVIDK